jgi:hypothetical protein
MKVLHITAIATSHGFTSFHARDALPLNVWLAVAISGESYEMRGRAFRTLRMGGYVVP